MKKARKLRSITAITLWIYVFMLILWLASMFCITNAVAQNYYSALLQQSYDFSEYTAMAGHLDNLYDNKEINEKSKTVPGFVDYYMLEAIKSANGTYLNQSGQSNNAVNVLRGESIPLQTAIVFYDKDGKILHQSGDFVYFKYVGEDIWQAEKEESETSGYGWLDLGEKNRENDPYTLFRTMYGGTRSLYDIRALKITGFLDGAEIKPVSMSYVTKTLIYQAVDSLQDSEDGDTLVTEDSGIFSVISDTDTSSVNSSEGTSETSIQYTISSLDHAGLFEWQQMFDNTAEVQNQDELITFYALYPEINIYDSGGKVVLYGPEYKNLLTALKDFGYPQYLINGYLYNSLKKNELSETVLFSSRTYRDLSNYDYDSEDPMPDPDFIMLTAISSHPLHSAMSQLILVYLQTLLLVVISVLILKLLIERNLTKPLAEVNAGFADDWSLVRYKDEKPLKWREPYELNDHYHSTLDRLRMDKNEITRLKTALDYAEKAEQNRRQMTSNIAHELKTPLAIISGYAEGLKEHIADDKRDHYLEVILTETERMDAMVLEMLDLSRLEAGQVKLARDEFSLSKLVSSVFDKLAISAQEKKLKISLDFKTDAVMLADEARITQVVTNLVNNAIKYTLPEGKITVRVDKNREGCRFAIENESSHFTAEQLAKVWDSFYRTDNSQSVKGTGLGLAIVRSIVELHGGRCSVRNTNTGVEFEFIIPDSV